MIYGLFIVSYVWSSLKLENSYSCDFSVDKLRGNCDDSFFHQLQQLGIVTYIPFGPSLRFLA